MALHGRVFSVFFIAVFCGETAGLCQYQYRRNNNTCCKVEDLWNDGETFAVSTFDCESGCCGEPDNEECCSTSTPLSGQTIGIIVGVSILGVVILTVVTIVLVWAFCKICKVLRDQTASRAAMREVQTTLDEIMQSSDMSGLMTFEQLFSPNPEPPPTSPGAIVHDTVIIKSMYDYSWIDSAPSSQGAYLREGRYSRPSYDATQETEEGGQTQGKRNPPPAYDDVCGDLPRAHP